MTIKQRYLDERLETDFVRLERFDLIVGGSQIVEEVLRCLLDVGYRQLVEREVVDDSGRPHFRLNVLSR